MGDYENLVEMGFDARRVTLALRKTKGFNDAITWLADNEDKSIEELEASSGEVAGSSSSAAGETLPEDTELVQDAGVANSLKCLDCGKLFPTQARAQFHAERTGHDNFEESKEEIKPLTEEEKRSKLEDLRKKLAEKRATESVESVKANKANEQIRRKRDTESDRIKEELRKKEQIKEAEKRRQEKRDDLIAKDKIRAQIKADQEARRVKAEKEKAEREGRVLEQAEAAAPAPVAAAPKPAAEYTEARLQLRLPAGQQPLIKSFPVDTKLCEVASVIFRERGFETSSFTTTFPRKTYSGSELKMTLKEAKLVPSAALIVG